MISKLAQYRAKIALIFTLVALYPSSAYAYLDPGTGSMLLSSVIGVLAASFYLIKGLYYKISRMSFSLLGLQTQARMHAPIVFYSEGKQYWNTFKPVINALDDLGIKMTYLSSDENDEGLAYCSENVQTRFIGTSNKAYMVLNTLEADLCVMTTPGLDVLQIRRSKGVKHYSHLIHAPTDVGKYKLFSFDYFDSVLCSGNHQIKSLRELEKSRGTKPKLLLKSGCSYMDVLADKFDQFPKFKKTEGTPPRVLVAPSWGKNGSLIRHGSDLIKPLAEAGFEVTIRPHPQSYLMESGVIDTIKSALGKYPNVHWDDETDGANALYSSDILISDLSGVVFDYAFILNKPVITINFEMDFRGMEANDLPYEIWELTMLAEVGQQISSDQINSLPEVIEKLAGSPNNIEKLKSVRDQHLYNYRSSGKIIAQQILDIAYSDLSQIADDESCDLLMHPKCPISQVSL